VRTQSHGSAGRSGSYGADSAGFHRRWLIPVVGLFTGNEPPSLNGPAAILSEIFNLVLLHFVYGYHLVVSTLEKIGIHVTTGLPKIYGFYRIIRRKSVCFRKRDPYPPL
jgi:hypothetical protein